MPDDGITPNTTVCRVLERAKIQPGELDHLGDMIDRVLIGTDNFIIYSVVQMARPSDESERDVRRASGARADHIWLRTVYPDDYECAKALRGKLSAIYMELAYVCDVVDSICRAGNLREGDAASLRRRATEMMARAMEMAYEGGEEKAIELLTNLKTHVTTLRDSKNRMRYILANIGALVVILAFFLSPLGAKLISLPLPRIDGNAAITITGLHVLALGALGSFFAVSADIKNVRVDHSVTWWEMLYAGAVRVPIGIIAALVVILLIAGEWLMTAISADALPWTYLLFGFLAGFSELFVPNALKQVEASANVASPSGGG